MHTGTKSISEVGRIVQDFVYQGYTDIKVTYDYMIEQWNIVAK